jgi:hypothetical protein
MRLLLTTISDGLTTEKCLNALNIFLTKSVTLTYQTAWLIPIFWTWKIPKNNRMQMMLCCNMQLNMRTNICINAFAQLMISYAILSQEILKTIGNCITKKPVATNNELIPPINWSPRQKEAIHANH